MFRIALELRSSKMGLIINLSVPVKKLIAFKWTESRNLATLDSVLKKFLFLRGSIFSFLSLISFRKAFVHSFDILRIYFRTKFFHTFSTYKISKIQYFVQVAASGANFA